MIIDLQCDKKFINFHGVGLWSID